MTCPASTLGLRIWTHRRFRVYRVEPEDSTTEGLAFKGFRGLGFP